MKSTLEVLGTTGIETIRVPMRDGVVLAATLYRPTADGEHPVILVRTPYSEPMSRSLPVLPALAEGFAVLVQNCRGTAGSEGELRAFENESADGLDTLAWILEQPWCDGRTAMFGASYLGMSQLAVSGHRPKGLRAIVPIVATNNYRDGLVFRQGALQLGQGLGWHLLKAAQTLGDRRARGEDVGAHAAAFAAVASNPEAAYRSLPLTSLTGVSDLVPSWTTWLEKENDPAYWDRINYTADRSATAVPGLHVGGWFDLFLGGTLDNFVEISTRATEEPVRQGQHLVIGPWTHADQTGAAGEMFFGSGAAAVIGLEAQQLRFLRESIEGADSSLPPVQLFVMGANVWRRENEWPLARTDWQRWYLHADAGLGTAEPHDGAAPRTYRHDPHDPVPTVGGATLINGGVDGGAEYMPGSRDQRRLDGREDILRFSSAPLEEDVEVTGPVTVTLHAATSAADTDFTARLVDVWPDGRAMGVADGIVRARYRKGMDEPQPVVPGEVARYEIDLVATSQLFRRGHRIRVDIASSNFPCYDRNSGSGKPAGSVEAGDLVPADQTVFLDRDHPSFITLPVIPAN